MSNQFNVDQDKRTKINGMIKATEVRLIDSDGKNFGVVSFHKALDIAETQGLDLVEISPNAVPPVCKVIDYGKYKYQMQKKASIVRKNQKIVDTKEVKMRPNTDTHDYNFKIKQMKKFFENGDKVKVNIRFRGREMMHQDLGRKLLERVCLDSEEYAKIETSIRMEGRRMVVVLAPKLSV